MHIEEAVALILSGHAPQDMTLDFCGEDIGDVGASSLSHALSSGNAPQGLTLGLTDNDISAEGAAALAEALTSGNAPQGLKLKLGENNISTEGVSLLAQALSSGKAPQRLTLSFVYKSIDNADVAILSEALSSGKAPQGLTLDLSENNLGDAGVIVLFEALSSGKAPEGLTLCLKNNKIGTSGVAALFKALSSGKAPQGLTLDLRVNNIGNEAIPLLCQALSSGKAPQGLTLNLLANRIHEVASYGLLHTIWQRRYPIGFKIKGVYKAEADLIEIESQGVKRLAATCINLAQPRKRVKSENQVLDAGGLPHDIVTHIASFAHPKGSDIGYNCQCFFDVRNVSISPLAELQIDISKVGKALGINDVEASIQRVIKGYLFNSNLTSKAKKSATDSLISALQNIEKKEAQTLIKNELASVENAASSYEVTAVNHP